MNAPATCGLTVNDSLDLSLESEEKGVAVPAAPVIMVHDTNIPNDNGYINCGQIVYEVNSSTEDSSLIEIEPRRQRSQQRKGYDKEKVPACPARSQSVDAPRGSHRSYSAPRSTLNKKTTKSTRERSQSQRSTRSTHKNNQEQIEVAPSSSGQIPTRKNVQEEYAPARERAGSRASTNTSMFME